MSITVDYPLGGWRLLLHWWTDGDRGHVVIAESRASLLAVARRIFAENPDAEVKAVLKVEIVAPSAKLERIATECYRIENIANFHLMACVRMDSAVKEGFALPAPFQQCEVFEPEDPESAPDSWARNSHYGCRHCKSRIRLVGMTPEELFARCAEDWERLRPDGDRSWLRHVGKHPELPAHASRAARASDDEALWYARKNFGHHAGGVELAEVDVDDVFGAEEEHFYTPACLTGEAMFFFRRFGEVDTATRKKIDAMLDAEKKASEARYQEEERKRLEERDEEEQKRHKAIVQFFAERSPFLRALKG